MKNIIFSVIGLLTFATVHAQQTIVIERPGIFTDLANAATALIVIPAAATTGIVAGTFEAVKEVVTGTATIVTHAPPVLVTPRVVVPPPAVVAPAPVIVSSPAVVAPAPVVPTTTIITQHGDGSVTAVTRQASAYELGPNVIIPVDPTHRVGPSPYVNPYVFRYR